MRGSRGQAGVDGSVPAVNVNAHPRKLVDRFRSFLEACPITVMDIGARGGIPRELEPLRSHIRLIAMEPDPTEARRLEERFHDLGLLSAVVLPEAAGPPGREFTLHVTRDPGRSSLLEPNREVIHRYGEAVQYEVVAKVPVRTSAVGSLLEERGLGPLDLLKLDVQGFELEVLRTLKDEQWARLLLLATEVEFVELYKGQPLFRVVDEYVSGRGFELFHLNRVFTNYGTGRWVPYGRGQLQFGDAYYLRTQVDGLAPEALARLIFLALYYGFRDYAWFLFHKHASRLGGLPDGHVELFRGFMAAFPAQRGAAGRTLAGNVRRVLNRLLYVALTWRRWNGRDGDNDLYYPLR